MKSSKTENVTKAVTCFFPDRWGRSRSYQWHFCSCCNHRHCGCSSDWPHTKPDVQREWFVGGNLGE